MTTKIHEENIRAALDKLINNLPNPDDMHKFLVKHDEDNKAYAILLKEHPYVKPILQAFQSNMIELDKVKDIRANLDLSINIFLEKNAKHTISIKEGQ